MKRIKKTIAIAFLLMLTLTACGLPQKKYATLEEYYNDNKIVRELLEKAMEEQSTEDMTMSIEVEGNKLTYVTVMDDVGEISFMQDYCKEYYKQEAAEFYEIAKDLAKDIEAEECFVGIKVEDSQGELIYEREYSSLTDESEYNADTESSEETTYETIEEAYNNNELTRQMIDLVAEASSQEDMVTESQIEGNTITYTLILPGVEDTPETREYASQCYDQETSNGFAEMIEQIKEMTGVDECTIVFKIGNDNGDILLEQTISSSPIGAYDADADASADTESE